MKTTISLVLPLLVLSTLAIASDKNWSNRTGNDLLPGCSLAVDFLDKKDQSKDLANDALECMDYIAGYLDGYDAASTVEKGKPFICFPENSNTGQAIRIVVKWMKDNPERLNESASNCVFKALFDAFACKYPK